MSYNESMMLQWEHKTDMKILQICDYAAKYRGNFIESLDYFKKNCLTDGDTMSYAFPDRMVKRNNQWFIDFKGENATYIYGSSPIQKVKSLRKIIKKNNIDIVHTHFTDIKTDLCVDLACFGLKVKKFKHYRSSFGNFSTVKKFFAALCYRRWDATLCVSPFIAEESKRNITSCKPVVLTDAVYLKRLDDYEKLTKADIGIPEDAFLCLAIGYDYRLKGIDLACEAVKKLREKQQNIYLAVCVASHMEKITEQIKEQFGELPEWIKLLPPRQDIASYYRAADLYIQPSRSEGFCYAIVEAAYCKKAVVASNCPGMQSHAQKNFDFFWFKRGNSADLAEKLAQAVNAADNAEMLTANRHSAELNYGIRAMSEKLYDIYVNM